MPVVRFDIHTRVPYAGGVRFGDAGAYERFDGTADFAAAPENEANRAIVDLALERYRATAGASRSAAAD